MSAPPPFDPARSLETVRYEYEMTLATALTIAAGNQGVETVTALESFLVHAGNLHEFLRPHEPQERRPGDVWASDFVAGFGLDVFDRDEIDDIDRRLRHITTWRQHERRRWNCLQMLQRIHAGMTAFVTQVDGSMRADLERTHVRVGVVLDGSE